MKRTILTAAIAAMALTATAADAQNARKRGVASGQEAKERAATRDLNAQQLAGNTASSAGAPTTAMPAPATDTTGATSPGMGAGTAGTAGGPGAMAPTPDTGTAAGTAPTGETTPQTDAMPSTPPATPEPR